MLHGRPRRIFETVILSPFFKSTPAFLSQQKSLVLPRGVVCWKLLKLLCYLILHEWCCKFDVASGAESAVGSHEKAVRCLEWLAEQQLLVSGSWDQSIRVWDCRAPPVSLLPCILLEQLVNSRLLFREFDPEQGGNCVVHIPLPGKVFSMSQSGNRLAVATSTRQNLSFDIRR